MKNYYTTQKYIGKFLKEKYHRADITLAELNYKFILDFVSYLSKHQRKIIKNHYITMYYEHIEWLC